MTSRHLKYFALAASLWLGALDIAISKEASDVPSADTDSIAVLAIGNSITHHAPLASIQWSGDWGMAATEASKDYAAQVAAALARKNQPAPTLTRINFASFERAFWQQPSDAKLAEIQAAAVRANIIIIQLSDNVSDSDFSTYDFEKHYLALSQDIKSKSPKAKILCIGPWWRNERKDEAVSRACKQVEGRYVRISDLSSDPVNRASSERQISNSGVGSHPGDQGMSAIAGRILAKIKSLETTKSPR